VIRVRVHEYGPEELKGKKKRRGAEEQVAEGATPILGKKKKAGGKARPDQKTPLTKSMQRAFTALTMWPGGVSTKEKAGEAPFSGGQGDNLGPGETIGDKGKCASKRGTTNAKTRTGIL